MQKSFPIAFLVETRVVREKEAFLACTILLTPSTFRAGDGTLIVVTQSDGTYLLFKGEELCLFHSQIIGLGMSPYVTCLYHPPFLLSPHTMHTCTHAHMHTCTHARPSFLIASSSLPSSPPSSLSDGSYSLVVDKSVPIAQLVVAHRHQVLLFRTGTCANSCDTK